MYTMILRRLRKLRLCLLMIFITATLFVPGSDVWMRAAKRKGLGKNSNKTDHPFAVGMAINFSRPFTHATTVTPPMTTYPTTKGVRPDAEYKEHLFTMMPFVRPANSPTQNPEKGVGTENEAPVQDHQHAGVGQPITDAQSWKIYNERLATLRNACRGSNYRDRLRPSQYSLTNILVEENLSFMYCRNKKVGTSFWSRLTSSVVGTRHYSRILKLDDYRKRRDILGNLAIRFLISRNPYERAMSAYIHKFLTPLVTSWEHDGEYIERLTRGDKDHVCGSNITFPEFIKYIIHSEATLEHQNPHFYPMSRQCWPCDIDYNIVAKFETFQQDAEHILSILNRIHNLNLKYEDFIDEDTWSWTDMTVKTMFRNQKFIEKCMSFHEAMRRVWRNFQIRGFIAINVSLPFAMGQPVTSRAYMEAYGEAKRMSGSREYRKSHKREAMLEAFSLVSMEDLEKLAQAYKTDCDFFGYDCRPDYIFNRSSQIKPLKYFNI